VTSIVLYGAYKMSSSLFQSLDLDKLLRDFHKESQLNDTNTPPSREGNHFTACRKAGWYLTANRSHTTQNIRAWISASAEKPVADIIEEIHQFCSVLQNHMFAWENGPIVGSEAQTITLLLLRYHSRDESIVTPFSQALCGLVEKRGYMSRIFQVGAMEDYDPLVGADLEGMPALFLEDLNVAASIAGIPGYAS
jgi:hypothetical protein